jgi:hypothetical protein
MEDGIVKDKTREHRPSTKDADHVLFSCLNERYFNFLALLCSGLALAGVWVT